MECILCTMWGRMPYAKKHTTPTTAAETEGAMVVGYWVATRQVKPDTVPRLCERHVTVVQMLDGQEERRATAEQARMQATQPPTPYYNQQVQELQQRQALIAGGLPAAHIPPSAIPAAPQAPVLAPQAMGAPFPLTPPNMAMAVQGIVPPTEPPNILRVGNEAHAGFNPQQPLVNGNTVTAQPALPMEANPAAPYMKPVITVDGISTTGGVGAPPGQPTAPLGAAKQVQEGAALIDAPCLFCKVMVHAGEVHNCPQAGAK